MALAAKFDKLTIDEVPSIVSAVKSDGVIKSGLADNYEVLAARVGSTDDKEAIAGCKVIVQLLDEVPMSQIFVKECLGACKYLGFILPGILIFFCKLNILLESNSRISYKLLLYV